MVDIVYTILPSDTAFRHKEGPYTNRANLRKRRSIEDDTPCIFMDDAQTFEIKKKNLKTVPMLLSFLIFYVCVINVIIKCDSSINAVDNSDYRHVGLSKFWHGHRHDDRLHGNYLRKRRTSAKRQADNEEKTPEAQEMKKYQENYRNIVSKSNVTGNAEYLEIGVYDNSKAVGYPHDLASNPYYIKNINFNMKMEKHQFSEKVVKLGVLLPVDPTHIFSLSKVLPILEMAVPAITSPDGPLPGWTILVDYRDTGCSSVDGPLAAFEFYVNGSAGKFLSTLITLVIDKVLYCIEDQFPF